MQPTPLAQYDFNNYTSGASSLNSSVSGPSAATITTPSLNTFNTSTAGNKYLILYFPSNPADTTGGVQLPSLSNIRTLEMWVKLPTPLVERGQYLLDARNVTADSYWIVYNYNAIGSALNNSQIYFNTKPLVINSSAPFPNLASIIAGNGWFQIVIVLPTNFNNNTVVNFFMSNGQNQGLKAEVGEVTVYSSALTTEEVKTVYNSKCSRYSLSSVPTGIPNPVAQYDFNNYTSQATTLASSVAGIGAATINQPTLNTYNTSSATNKYLVLYYQNTLVQAGGLTIPSITGIRAVEMWVRLPSRQGYGAYLLDFRTGASDAFWITSSSEDSIGTFFNNATIWLNTTAQTVNPTAGTPRIQQSLASASASLGWFQIVIQPTSSFTDDIALFMRYTGEQAFPGEVADIYVYTTSLTTSDVKTIYNTKCARYGLSPITLNSFAFAVGFSTVTTNVAYTANGPTILPVSASALPPDVNQFTILSLNATATSSDAFGVWRNGTSVTSAWGGASSNDPNALQYSVGGSVATGAGSISYDYGEAVIFQSNLSTFDRQRMEGYLAWKWTLRNLLPANHPYKNVPPLINYWQVDAANWTNNWQTYLNSVIALNSNATMSYTQSSMGATIASGAKWIGGVLAPNGKIYCIPYGNNTFLIIDPVAGTATTNNFGLSFSGDNQYWGGVLGRDGKIYCIPYTATTIIIIDPTTDTATTNTFGLNLTGSFKWTGGVLARNGIIYCAPADATDILMINTINNTASRGTLGMSLTGTNKYNGAVLGANENVYFIPASRQDVLIIFPTDPVATLQTNLSVSGGIPSGTNKWGGGVLAANGKIYCVPFNYDGVLIIDTSPTQGIGVITQLGWNLGMTGYIGGALGVDGKIYLMPYNVFQANVGIISPSATTGTFTKDSTNNGTGTFPYAGGILGPNGVIYCPPFVGATTILRITPSTTPVFNSALFQTPYFNKF
jgi:hypothetical protein